MQTHTCEPHMHKHKQAPQWERTAAATTVCLFLCGRPIPMGGLSKPFLIHLISWTQEPGPQTKSSFTHAAAAYGYMWSQESVHHKTFFCIPPASPASTDKTTEVFLTRYDLSASIVVFFFPRVLPDHYPVLDRHMALQDLQTGYWVTGKITEMTYNGEQRSTPQLQIIAQSSIHIS